MTQGMTLGRVGLAGAAVLIALAGGCATTSHSEAKEQAYDRWTAARSGIQYGVAMQKFEVGDLDKAQRTIEQTIGMDPDNARYYVLAARIALEKSELERAFRHLELAVEHDPELADAHYYRGVIFQRWQQYEPALRSYEQAYEHEPDNVSGLLAAAEMLVKLNRPDEAIERLRAKLVYFEHNAAIRVAIARIYQMRRNLPEALAMYREANLLAPDDPAVLEQLAMAEYSAGEYGEAIHHLHQLLSKEELADRRDLRIALADCYQATGRPADARSILLKLVRDDDNDPNAWIKLGQAAWIVGDDARLREAANRAVALAPDRFESYLLAGMVARRGGHNDAALRQFEQAARLAPDSALPQLLKGMTLQDAGQLDAAERAYRAALRIDPQDRRAQRLLAGLEGT